MMAGFADAMAEMNDLGFWAGGDDMQTHVTNWFANNMDAGQAAIANDIMNGNAEQFAGLDWLISGGNYWEGTFEGQNGGSSWGMYDMIDGVRNDGEWNMFGQNEDGSYINATEAWFNDWINGQNSGWGNEAYLKEYMNSSDSYMSLFNATNDIVFWDTTGGGGGDGGDDGGDGIIWAENVVYPVNTDCLKQVTDQDVVDYFTQVGKSQAAIDGVAAGLVQITTHVATGRVSRGGVS